MTVNYSHINHDKYKWYRKHNAGRRAEGRRAEGRRAGVFFRPPRPSLAVRRQNTGYGRKIQPPPEPKFTALGSK